MNFTDEQRIAVEAESSVAVTAGAGTGKTHMLSERYIHHLIAHKFSPLEIVAVTFTEKAAAELRSRIRSKAAERLSAWSGASAELEAAQISTIHSLAMRICREHPEAAGLPYDFSVLNELDSSLRTAEWLAWAFDSMPPEIYERVPFSTLQATIRAFLNDPITAERALEKDGEHWPELASQTRKDALDKLLTDSSWLDAFNVVKNCSGTKGDRIEEARLTAFGAVSALEAGEEIEDLIAALTSIDLRGGSKKSWPQGGLDAVKEALKSLRESARRASSEGLITLKPGPADYRLLLLLPYIRAAFKHVREHIALAKRQARMLDFADLEDHALRALANDDVKRYYKERWRAFLIDEFQDVNPVQAELIDKLAEGSILTIVGDEKQSIYGFRRADAEVFQRFRERIVSNGGSEVRLSLSFRAHDELLEKINCISLSALGALHQHLEAFRKQKPHLGPHAQICIVQSERETNKHQRQIAEAQKIASLIREALDAKLLVHDKDTNELRAVEPRDIAILSRAWDPLKIYGDALEAMKIPSVHTGGGSLLDAREAKDAWMLLRFLANVGDDLALASVLRSPFFAVSDRVLFQFSQEGKRNISWRERMKETALPDLIRPNQILNELIKASRTESPSRLLQIADRMCGYSAVIANLPGAARREADWRGFLDLVRELERGAADLYALARRIRRFINAEIEVPRPPLEAGEAVALMTIHAAKGLEWPIVVTPDLSRSSPSSQPAVYFDAELGIALKLEDEKGDVEKPILYTLLSDRRKKREELESRRILYVALTRARDRLILTAADEKGGGLEILLPGLKAAGIEPEFIPI